MYKVMGTSYNAITAKGEGIITILCAFSSISLGKSRGDTVAKSVGNSILLSLLSGLILTAISLAFSDGIITVFGGTVNKETYNYSKEYFFG